MSQTEEFRIEKYQDSYRDQLLDVWENSVLATHHFLLPADFESIKALVLTMDFNDFQVYCLLNGSELAGFIGVADDKVEMLFIAPEFMGQGLGRRLMDFAIGSMQICKVDVNEQNGKALRFYQKIGFKIYERSPLDDQGKAYPILRMNMNSEDEY